MDETCRAIAKYVGHHLCLTVDFIDDISWEERYRLLDAGLIDVAWICGAPYVRRIDQAVPIELLAAPVWQGDRYEDRPVYFSDVVVHGDSPFQTFADLRGAVWAYNEPGSFSGYEAMRYYLAVQGVDGRFFGRAVESGAHQRSLEQLRTCEVDVAAIDSTVLELAVRTQPALRHQLRTIASIGPSPMPPWVVSIGVASQLRAALRHLFTTMANDRTGRAILTNGMIARFAAVQDADYDPTRTMLQFAAAIKLAPSIDGANRS
jgi:phosphonate transport system substrate-binding protein